MKKSTFFTISAVIILLMAVFYTVQQSSMAYTQCKAYESFYCETLMAQQCIGGEIWGFELEGSFCYLGVCIGYYEAFCVDIDGIDRISLLCEDSMSYECGGW